MKKLLVVLFSLALIFSCSKNQTDPSKPGEGDIELTYNLEGSQLTNFLDKVEYDSDYSYTLVHKYITGDESCSYRFAYVTVPANVNATKVVLVSDRGEETSRVISGVGRKAIANLIPGRTYTYTLFSPEGKEVKKAKIKTEGRVRVIWTRTLHNFRDIGGWKGLNGKHIKYGYLIRGGEVITLNDDLTKCEKDDYGCLINQVGIDYDMDFRTDEGAGYFYQSPLGIEFKRIPLSAYSSVITKKERQGAYKQAILQFIENVKAGKCTYMHCQGGADRTGTIVFFIEGLLGVSESDLAKDYELTTFYYHKERNDTERYATMIKDLMRLYAGGGTLSDAIYNCAKDMGLTDVNINELRSLMLE